MLNSNAALTWVEKNIFVWLKISIGWNAILGHGGLNCRCYQGSRWWNSLDNGHRMMAKFKHWEPTFTCTTAPVIYVYLNEVQLMS